VYPLSGSFGLRLQAKGYPDIASRRFLGRLTSDHGHIPVLGLVDWDPDGIAILSTYKYGSCRLAHEEVARADTPGLGLSKLQWLGVQSQHFSRKAGSEGGTATAALCDMQGVMKLTDRDRRKAHQMLAWEACREDGSEAGWRVELQRMLMLNVKAEMQIVDELPGGFASWLSSELQRI